MIILTSVVILILLGMWMMRAEHGALEFIGLIVTVFLGLIFIIMLVSIPANHYTGKAEVERYNVLKDTISKSREGRMSELERASLTKEIIDYNKDLAGVKYWNNSLLDIFIYDGLAELDYLE